MYAIKCNNWPTLQTLGENDVKLALEMGVIFQIVSNCLV